MKVFKLVVAGVAIAAAAVFGLNAVQGSNATAASRECGNNSIIACGAMSETELASEYKANKKGDIHTIFSEYGITSDMIKNHAGKKGYVTKSGKVVVDGKTVADNAKSLGREYNRGGTKKKIGNKTYYEGDTQIRFASKQLDAFVFFDKDGRFVAAVLLVCGNTVRATPPPAPKKPVYKCDTLTANKVGSSRTEYEFITSATAKDGATIVDYTYNFGDGKTATTGSTTRHAYATAGTYKASVKVNVKVNGKTVVAPGTCEATVKIEKEHCPVPGKEHLPKDSPECKEDKPAIDITKVVNDVEHVKVAVNEVFTYKIVVTNRGNVTLKNAVVTDKAPKEVTLLTASEGKITADTWTYTISELKVGESKTYELTAKYAKYAANTHINNVCVDTPTVPGSPDDCDEASTETTEKIKICDTDDNVVKEIEKSEFDASHMTTDYKKCDSPDVPELPKTGMADTIGAVLGAGSLVSVGAAYLASRRSV